MTVDKQFQMVADSLPVLLWVSDAVGIRHFYNSNWLNCTGYIMDDDYLDGWEIFINPDDRERYFESYSCAFDYRLTSTIAYRLKDKDGRYFWVLEKAVPHYSADGTFAGYIGSCTDIDDLMQSKDANGKLDARNHEGMFLEESLRVAFDSADLGYFYMHIFNRSIFVKNGRFKEFFGYGQDDNFSYDDAVNQIHPEYRQAVYEAVESAIAKGIRFDMEYPIIGHKDGTTRWVRGIGSIHHDKEGINTYFTAVVHEITEKKKNEIRKNDFISMVSHELKTPLSSLSAILQTVEGKLKRSDDDYTQEAFDKAMGQVRKMTNLINGFLDISKLDAGKIRIDRSCFDIVELIHEQIRETALTISSHHIHFLACQPSMLNADYDKISYVISNLIRNAVKYSTPGKTITIHCQSGCEQVQISVTDEGIGIESQDRERLFERYYRANNSITQHTSGSGIGLYLCAEIIQRHDGKIWVDSQPGVGSTFYFSLPNKSNG